MTDRSDPLDGVDFSALLEGEPAELPAPDADVPMVKTSINLPLPLYEALTEEARRTGVGRSGRTRQPEAQATLTKIWGRPEPRSAAWGDVLLA